MDNKNDENQNQELYKTMTKEELAARVKKFREIENKEIYSSLSDK